MKPTEKQPANPGRLTPGANPGRPSREANPGRPTPEANPSSPTPGANPGKPTPEANPGRLTRGANPGRSTSGKQPRNWCSYILLSLLNCRRQIKEPLIHCLSLYSIRQHTMSRCAVICFAYAFIQCGVESRPLATVSLGRIRCHQNLVRDFA